MPRGSAKKTYCATYDSSSDEDFVPSGEGARPRASKQSIAVCTRRRKQPERWSIQRNALLWFRWATVLAGRNLPALKRRRVETSGELRSQVLPKETWRDVFCCDDRETLECLQLACGRFDRIIKTKMNGVCLRPIYSVSLSQTEYAIQAQVIPAMRGNKPTKRVSPDHLDGRKIIYKANSVEMATEWIFAGLRCSQVCNSFELHYVAMSKHFLTQLKEAASTFNVSGYLDLSFVGFPDDVTPATLIGAFPGLGDVRTKSARLQWKHIDDALLRCYAEKGLWRSFPRATKGVEYRRISEKGILDFCFGYNQQERGIVRDLKLRKPRVTKEFILNLVKVADIPKQNQSDFEEFKHNTDTDGSFAAIVHGNKALRVSYTWVVQRGFE